MKVCEIAKRIRESKEFKVIDEQLEHLENNKSVRIHDREVACKVLFDSNYYNVVSCGKVKFAVGMVEKKHFYIESEFQEWIDYFEFDCKVSEYLMKNVIRIERTLNSRIAYCVSELVEKGNLNSEGRNDLIQKIKNTSR